MCACVAYKCVMHCVTVTIVYVTLCVFVMYHVCGMSQRYDSSVSRIGLCCVFGSVSWLHTPCEYHQQGR